MAYKFDENGKTTKKENKNRGLVAQNKTPKQLYMTKGVEKIKKLTNSGKHKEASDLYKRLFPGV